MGAPTFTGHVTAPSVRKQRALGSQPPLASVTHCSLLLAPRAKQTCPSGTQGPQQPGGKCHQHSPGGHSPPVAQTRRQVAALEGVNP